MKKTLQLVVSLTVIAAVCAAVLAVVNDITKTRIANIQTLKANNAAKLVLPPGVKAIEMREDPENAEVKAFIGYGDGAKKTVLGYAVPGVSENGYGGTIRIMVGLTAKRAIVSYQVLAANETPGLGAKLGDPEFSKQFAGKSAGRLAVRKDGGEIDAITGATITSRAVCGAIADANARVDRLEGKATASAKKSVNEGKMLCDPTQTELARKVLPKGTDSVVAQPQSGDFRFPIFVGKDAAGKVTGYAITGTGRGKGPSGEIMLHILFGFDAKGQLSRSASPVYINRPEGNPQDMIRAQNTAFNAAMQEAMARAKSAVR